MWELDSLTPCWWSFTNYSTIQRWSWKYDQPSAPAQEMFCKEHSSWKLCSTASLPDTTFRSHSTPAFNMCPLHKLSNKLSSNFTVKTTIISVDISTKWNWNPCFYFPFNWELLSKTLAFQRLTSMFLVPQIEFFCIPRVSPWLYPSMLCNKLYFFFFSPQERGDGDKSNFG